MDGIRLATVEDGEEVLGLLVNAAGWLKANGTTQWDYYLTDLERNKGDVMDSIEGEATYVLEKRGRIIATLTLASGPNDWDEELWGEKSSGEAAYLHRFVVHRDFSGKGIGSELLDWAEDKAKAAGKKSIRLDCLASNVGLNRYYQNRYTLKEIIHHHGRHSKYEISL